MSEKKFINIRMDYNAKLHFTALSEQLMESKNDIVSSAVKKYCNPAYYEPRGLFNRKGSGKA